MTREEAIQVLENELKANCKICMHPQEVGYCEHTCTYKEAMETAISALSAEPIKVITDDTIEVRYTDFENIKRIILTNGDIFCKMFYEDARQNDDSDYDSLVPDEYKTEPSDLISRADALKEMAQAECGVDYEYHCEVDNCTCSYIQRILDIPSAERVGVWIRQNDELKISDYQCSVCGHYQDDKTNYCSKCGAKMKGGTE